MDTRAMMEKFGSMIETVSMDRDGDLDFLKILIPDIMQLTVKDRIKYRKILNNLINKFVFPEDQPQSKSMQTE